MNHQPTTAAAGARTSADDSAKMSAVRTPLPRAARAVRILAAAALSVTALPFLPGTAPASAGLVSSSAGSAGGAAALGRAADYVEVGAIPRIPAGLTFDEGFSIVDGETVVESGNNGIPVISDATGRMYQFYQLEKVTGTQTNRRVGAVVRDLKSLQVTETFLLPAEIHIIKRFPEGRGEIPHAVDAEGKRLFFWLDHADNEANPSQAGYERSIFVLDESNPTSADLTRVESLEKALVGEVEAQPFLDYGADQVDHTFDVVENPTAAAEHVGAMVDEPVPSAGGIDPDNVHVPDPRLVDTGIPQDGSLDMRGITYIRGKLYVIMAKPAPQDPPVEPVVLVQINAGPTVGAGNQVHPDLFDVDFSRPLRGCRSIYSRDFVGSRFTGSVPVMIANNEFFVPCQASNTAVVVRIATDTLSQVDGPETVFTGTGLPIGYLVDPAGGRIHFRVFTPLGSAVLTFDTAEKNYIGLQAVDNLATPVVADVAWGIDRNTGRVYTQVGGSQRFGLAFLSGRFTPVQPPTIHPELPAPTAGANSAYLKMIPRDSANGRTYVQDGTTLARTDQVFHVIEDAPPALQPPPADPDRNTKDVPEELGLTGASYSGGGSGYGVRQLLVGGVGGFVPARITDPQNFYPERPLCHRSDREAILAHVQDAKFSNALQSAQATPVVTDSGTQQDIGTPSRCSQTGRINVAGVTNENADELVTDSAVLENRCEFCAGALRQVFDTVNKAVDDQLDGSDDGDLKPTADRAAGQPWPFTTAACRPDARDVTTGPSENFPRSPLPVSGSTALNGFTANVNCTEPTEVRASASTSSPGVADLQKAAVDNLRDNAPAIAAPWIKLVDNMASIVSKALPKVTVASASTSTRSYLDPELGVVTVTESVVKGVDIGGVIQIGGIYSKATSVANGRPGGARSTYERALWGVVAPGVNCNLCATPAQMEQLATGLSTVLGDRGRVIVPKVDGELLKGSPGGYQAAVQRDPFTAASNDIVSGDGLVDVPALEIQLFNDGLQWGRQRQIIQFAGVKANSQYGIFCLGGGTVEGGHCVLPPTPPNSLTVSLTDDKFAPLAGGSFTAKGPETQSCTTGADGRCTMPELANGSYTVSQTKAPDGYSTAKDLSVKMTGGSRTANFVNRLDAGRIIITLSDSDTGAPLAGGAFDVVGDANRNGTREPTDPVVARCTTDASGRCPLKGAKGDVQTVSLGAYVVQQTAAPQGYTPAPPTAFALVEPGDEATLDFTNGTTPTVVLGISSGGAAPIGSVSPAIGGGGFDDLPFGPVADLIEWALRNPGQAILFASSVALFGMPLWQSWKRRQLIGASIHPF